MLQPEPNRVDRHQTLIRFSTPITSEPKSAAQRAGDCRPVWRSARWPISAFGYIGVAMSARTRGAHDSLLLAEHEVSILSQHVGSPIDREYLCRDFLRLRQIHGGLPDIRRS
jgi:hypothetical protein